jgi:hypothetical protein
MTAWAGAQRRPRYGQKVGPALQERRNIWAIGPCSPSILVALSELSSMVGTSSWGSVLGSVRPRPDFTPGYNPIAPSALRNTSHYRNQRAAKSTRETIPNTP